MVGRGYLLLVFFGLLLSMIILDTEPGWNLVIFLGFALVAGMLLYRSEVLVPQFKSWMIFSILCLISIAGAAYSRSRIRRAAGILYPVAVLYLLGWGCFLIFQIRPIYEMGWIVFGLILFTLITMVILNQGKTKSQDASPVPLVFELFVVLYNLFWLSSLLWK